MRCSQLIKSKQVQLQLSDKKHQTLLFVPGKTDASLTVLQKLLSKIETSKIRKLTNDIKNKNSSFKQYLSENRIANIKLQDFLKFQSYYDKILTRSKNGTIRYEAEQIKRGFAQLRSKLQEHDVTDLATRIKYCSSTICREIEKLDKRGLEYEGLNLLRNTCLVSKQIQQDEKQNGIYEHLNNNQIKKAVSIEKGELQFKYSLFQR